MQSRSGRAGGLNRYAEIPNGMAANAFEESSAIFRISGTSYFTKIELCDALSVSDCTSRYSTDDIRRASMIVKHMLETRSLPESDLVAESEPSVAGVEGNDIDEMRPLPESIASSGPPKSRTADVEATVRETGSKPGATSAPDSVHRLLGYSRQPQHVVAHPQHPAGRLSVRLLKRNK